MLIRIALVALGLILYLLNPNDRSLWQETTTANTMTRLLGPGRQPGILLVAGGTDWPLDYGGRVGRSGEVLGW